ncbi:SUMF1/EgtB/PvdO family nonheme iron enzyme [Rugamonas sp. FT107W]|uniref:SUMF1/EgtB/PvdO family nonheme iron enzyme n=1 Tax=Duganella vulcania TaxID=2692166 RepID=A0A845HLE6_9BURK|nr:SUMF1/EgtB/PvdO family nonheme iron enzyme [Duganella vulcania]
MLLWPVYPNIGVDNRNQWDMVRDLPGGVAGVRQLIQDFHARGVKVFFPTMPWDTGSRDVGTTMHQATAALMAEIGADGVNGDTMDGLPLAYRTASDATGHPVALEPELAFKDDGMLAYNQQSWGYWTTPLVPLVSKWKWMEPRHMVHVCDRWATDRTNILQDAFFNGVGIESWENVWGWWNQFTARDGEVMRRIATIYRAFPDHLVSAGWVPHVPTLHYGVYASEFPLQGSTLWTIINRTDWDVNERIMRVAHQPGQRYFDLWNGKEIKPLIREGYAELSMPMEAHGYGAVLRVDRDAHVANLDATLKRLALQAARPLQSYSSEWKPLPQTMTPVEATPPATSQPEGMVRIPGAVFDFQVHGIEIEGENKPGLDVQYPWESVARRGHVHSLAIKPFYIDKHPVTNAQFKAFVGATAYRPKDAHNFLKHWIDGSPKAGDENRPVTWVSLEDARAYLRWAGKRLPNEWEWQYAAQGGDGRLYPWGNTWDAAMVPAPAKGRELPAPEPVGQHPQGASPFGVEDMIGHVWQWTNEFADEHTRAAILRGGSYYQPQDSYWYFPQAYKLNEHGKYLLMAPSKDRSGGIGFRGVKDALPL